MIKVKDFAPIYGNPTLTSLDGEERANLDSIGGREAEFGVYIVDTTPPNGKRWTGAFAGDPPEAVFEDIPPPSTTENILNAPAKGFGGPTLKDQINVSRETYRKSQQPNVLLQGRVHSPEGGAERVVGSAGDDGSRSKVAIRKSGLPG